MYEDEDYSEFDANMYQIEDDTRIKQEAECPRCVRGCSYCLMLER